MCLCYDNDHHVWYTGGIGENDILLARYGVSFWPFRRSVAVQHFGLMS